MTEPDHPACDSPECVWCQPTLNTPYESPERHWQTVDNRTRNEIAPARRKARSRLPLGRVQEPTQTDLYTGDSEIVSRLRNDVSAWRGNHWPGATPPTARLLEYWARPAGQGPDRRLFFAQREAIEAVVYLTEVADQSHYALQPRTAQQFEAVATQRTGADMLTATQVRTLARGLDETVPAETQLDVWRRTLPIKSGRLVVFNDEGHHHDLTAVPRPQHR